MKYIKKNSDNKYQLPLTRLDKTKTKTKTRQFIFQNTICGSPISTSRRSLCPLELAGAGAGAAAERNGAIEAAPAEETKEKDEGMQAPRPAEEVSKPALAPTPTPTPTPGAIIAAPADAVKALEVDLVDDEIHLVIPDIKDGILLITFSLISENPGLESAALRESTGQEKAPPSASV